MKTPSLILCSTTLALCFAAASAQAQYVSPRSPGAGNGSGLVLPALSPTPLVITNHQWIVTSPADGGPGTLRDAIAQAAAGDTIVFELPYPAAIILTNTLVISEDLSVLGPGPKQLTITRGSGTNT